jgi:hypothetical protein
MNTDMRFEDMLRIVAYAVCPATFGTRCVGELFIRTEYWTLLEEHYVDDIPMSGISSTLLVRK